MIFNWRIEMLKFENGERFPVLINRNDGMPLFKPTVFTASMVRNKGNAESTTGANLNIYKHIF